MTFLCGHSSGESAGRQVLTTETVESRLRSRKSRRLTAIMSDDEALPGHAAAHPVELPTDVLDDVASVVGAEVTVLGRLTGGFDVGAMRVQLAGRANAVLKAWARARPNQLDEVLRAQRVIEHMRRC